MLRKLQFIFFTCQKLILAHFCKLSCKDRDLCWPKKYRVACFSQFFPSEVRKILRKSQPQIREKLRKLNLRKKSVFLIKKTCTRYSSPFSCNINILLLQQFMILIQINSNIFLISGVQHPVLACVEKNSEKILTDLYCSDIIGSGIELKRACNIQDCKQR